MAEDDTTQGDMGEFTPAEEVPVENWIPHPVSDSAEYLDRPDPVYLDDEEDADGADSA